MSTIDAPLEFMAELHGLEPVYRASYAPNGLGGLVVLTTSQGTFTWAVEVAKREAGGHWSLQGTTVGALMAGAWFVLQKHDSGAAVLQFWGDRVLLREDRGAIVP